MTKIIKKNGTIENFDWSKIENAVNKSARRVHKSVDDISDKLKEAIDKKIKELDSISVYDMHEIVQEALSEIDEAVFREYQSYRNYKKRFIHVFSNILDTGTRVMDIGDKENANKNSLLVSTKKGIMVSELGKQIMLEYELPKNAKTAHNSGDIYIHDLGDRWWKSINCCLFDMGTLLRGGFKLNGVDYTEPTSVESAMRVLSDIVLEASSQQYGGFTVPEIDSVLAPYVAKGLTSSREYYRKQLPTIGDDILYDLARNYVKRALKQGFQAVETRLNTISNSNTQTPFVTFTFGLDTSEEGRMVIDAILNNRVKGIGKQKITPVFPKLVFLNRYGISGKKGDPNYDMYVKSLHCMTKRMYPDLLSLNNGFLGDVFDKYGKAISPMGCRAYLGLYTAPGDDAPHFIGRANGGAVTLNTVRYAIEADSIKEYFDILDENFDLALQVHLAQFDYMKDAKASTNPLFFVEGGCSTRLQPDDTIEKALKTFTWSFGYIGLDEASYIMTGMGIHESNVFACMVLEHLNMRIEEAKEKHGLLFALYGTPAESLCYKFRDKDLAEYGEIKGVNDKPYYMNSFHVNVKAEVNALEKQDIEYPMFHLSNGGHIQYSEFPQVRNFKAFQQIMDEAMVKGFYAGANLQLDNCNDCHEEGDFGKKAVCPTCGSTHVTSVCRVCGYLGYKQVDGDSRINDAKLAEVADRVDHI